MPRSPTGPAWFQWCLHLGTPIYGFPGGLAFHNTLTGCEGTQRVTIPRKPAGSCMAFSDLSLRVRVLKTHNTHGTRTQPKPRLGLEPMGWDLNPLSFFLINVFIFDCVGSLLLCAGFSLVAASGGYSSLWYVGFSLWWLLLLWSMGFSSCSTRAQ